MRGDRIVNGGAVIITSACSRRHIALGSAAALVRYVASFSTENDGARSSLPKGIRMVPHSNSSKFWKLLVDKASGTLRDRLEGDKIVTVYVASASEDQLFPTTAADDDPDECPTTDKVRDSILQFLKGRGHRAHDLGSGSHISKTIQLSNALQTQQSSSFDNIRGILLTGYSSSTGNSSSTINPLVWSAAQGAAILANKHDGVRAMACQDVTGARVSRSIYQTNLLVLTGGEKRMQEILDGWMQQQVKGAPKSIVGETPDYWPDDDEQITTVIQNFSNAIQTVERTEKQP